MAGRETGYGMGAMGAGSGRKLGLGHAGLTGLGLVLTLGACGQTTNDWDLRAPDRGISTSAAVRDLASRPATDARGIISYPGYQVVVANRGEDVGPAGEQVAHLVAADQPPQRVAGKRAIACALADRLEETLGAG